MIVWTKVEKNKMKEVWNKHSIDELCKLFNCSTEDIHKFGRDNLLPSKRFKHWSEEQIKYLIQHYNTMPLEELSIKLKHGPRSITNKAKELCLPPKKRSRG